MSEQSASISEVFHSFGEPLRTSIVIAMQVAGLTAMNRMQRARAGEHVDSPERAAIKSRMVTERQAAQSAVRQAWPDAWWRRADARETTDASTRWPRAVWAQATRTPVGCRSGVGWESGGGVLTKREGRRRPCLTIGVARRRSAG